MRFPTRLSCSLARLHAFTGLWLLLLPLSSASLLAQEPDSTRTFTLPGVVLEHGSDFPVPGASVEIPELDRNVFADSLGRFAFTDLPEGLHTFSTRRIGYVENVEASEVREGDVLIVRILPKPIVLEGIEALADRLDQRTKATGVASRTADRRELRMTTAPTATDFLRERLRVRPVRCRGDGFVSGRRCLLVRGRSRRAALYVDDMRQPAGLSMLDTYDPDELYRVEVYPALRMVRLYTRWYIERMAERGQSLPAICIVCGG